MQSDDGIPGPSAHLTDTLADAASLQPAQTGLPSLTKEAAIILQLGWPVMLTYVLSFGIPLSTVLIGGRLGKQHLAALALGTMTVNVTGMAVVIGLLSGLDTLASQAFGAGELRAMGVLLQRAVLVGLCACMPIIAFWCSGVGRVLELCGQDAEAASLAVFYTRIATVQQAGPAATSEFTLWPSVPLIELLRTRSRASLRSTRDG